MNPSPSSRWGAEPPTVSQTSRLGLPNQKILSKVISSKKTPIPSSNYNNVFCRPLTSNLKRGGGKLIGYGRISSRRDTSMFRNDSCVMPM